MSSSVVRKRGSMMNCSMTNCLRSLQMGCSLRFTHENNCEMQFPFVYVYICSSGVDTQPTFICSVMVPRMSDASCPVWLTWNHGLPAICSQFNDFKCEIRINKSLGPSTTIHIHSLTWNLWIYQLKSAQVIDALKKLGDEPISEARRQASPCDLLEWQPAVTSAIGLWRVASETVSLADMMSPPIFFLEAEMTVFGWKGWTAGVYAANPEPITHCTG